MKKQFLLIFLLLLSSVKTLAQSYLLKEKSFIVDKKKQAVVKVQVIDKAGNIKDEGSGTIIKGGLVLTNRHVLVNSIKEKKDHIRIITKEGASFSDTYVAKCWDQNNTDLCVLMSDQMRKEKRYKEYFNLSSEDPRKGSLVGILGHCQFRNGDKKDYHFKETKVIRNEDNFLDKVLSSYIEKRSDRNNMNIRLISVKSENCNGGSGGPVFDTMTGELLAITTESYESNNLSIQHNLSIPSSEIKKFIHGLDSKFSAPASLVKDWVRAEKSDFKSKSKKNRKKLVLDEIDRMARSIIFEEN